MRTQPIASLLLLAAAVLPACSDEGETCADGDCSAGGSNPGVTTGTTTTGSSTSSTGQGGSGGGGAPLNTEIAFTDYVTGEPLAGETVVVNAADGSVVSQTVTGADGTVPVEIPAGGSVSVFYTFSFWAQGTEYPYRRAHTVYPGNAQPVRIALEDGFVFEAEPGSGYMLVGVTWDTVPGAGQYLAKSNCFSKAVAAPALAVAADNTDCTNDGLYDVVIAAYDQLGVLNRYAVLPDQQFIDDTKLNHDVSWGDGGQLGDIPYSVINLPDTTSAVDIRSTATSATHGTPISLEQTMSHDISDEVEVGGSVKHAVGFGDRHCTNIVVDAQAQSAAYNRCGATASLLPITFDASRLARFSGQGTPTTLSWEESVAGELGDLMSVGVVDQADGGPATISWSAVLAPGANSITRPDLPPGLEGYALTEADGVLATNVDVHDVDGLGAALESGDLWSNSESASGD